MAEPITGKCVWRSGEGGGELSLRSDDPNRLSITATGAYNAISTTYTFDLTDKAHPTQKREHSTWWGASNTDSMEPIARDPSRRVRFQSCTNRLREQTSPLTGLMQRVTNLF